MMSALIISICISVGEIQSLPHDSMSTAMSSDENEIIYNRVSFQFDINTRGWQSFDRWRINEPQASTFGEITYSVEIEHRKRQHLLISGASSTFPYFELKPGLSSNWLYTVDTNSWQNVDNGDFPPSGIFPLMIQLCSKITALEFDLDSSNRSWIFDTVLLTWEVTEVHGRSPYKLNRGSTNIYEDMLNVYKVAAVAVVQSQSNCQCNQSVFALLYSSDFRRSTYEVRCVNREGTESYEWIQIEPKNENPSSSRVTVTVNNKNMMKPEVIGVAIQHVKCNC